MDTKIATALSTSQSFWAGTGRHDAKSQMKYFSALNKVLEAVNTTYISEAEESSDNFFIELRTLLMFAYSQHNAREAVAHYRSLCTALYNYSVGLSKTVDKDTFKYAVNKATDYNPGVGVIKTKQPERHEIMEIAVTLTTQFFGYNHAESERSRRLWDSRLRSRCRKYEQSDIFLKVWTSRMHLINAMPLPSLP